MKAMIQISGIFCALLLSASMVMASDDGWLHSSESDELFAISQRAVKNYLYAGNGIREQEAKASLAEEIDKLAKIVRNLSVKPDSHIDEGQMAFLRMSMTELAALAAEPYSVDNAYIVMDLSEVILEAAEALHFEGEKTENMSEMLLLEHQFFLLERMGKLYISIKAGVSDFNTKRQMDEAINEFEQGLATIGKYSYTGSENAKVMTMSKYWSLSRPMLEKSEQAKAPRTVFLAIEWMEKSIKGLIDYHRTI